MANTTSGTVTFDKSFAVDEIIAEAYERIGSQVTSFLHRVDYVIQGFSGQSEYTFNQDVQVTDLGNGSDESLWQSASGTIGYVRGDSSKIAVSYTHLTLPTILLV